METVMETIQTGPMQICSRTIRVNGTIPMVMELEIIPMTLPMMVAKRLILMVTATETMQTADHKVICFQMILRSGMIQMVTALETMEIGLPVMERNGKMMTATGMETIQTEPRW